MAKPDGVSDSRCKILSRRSFLRGSALTTVGATMIEAATALVGTAHAQGSLGGGAQAAAPGPPAACGPDAVSIALEVNGIQCLLQVEPRMTLAEALRGPLGLTGTKIACNRGSCSACTVWLDDLTVCACMLLAIDVGRRRVTTIEGLAQGDALHPVQAAFIDHDALQCGFCTPGMVMSCAALVDHAHGVTAEEVRNAISGHYCRCGTYPHVIEATLAAAGARKG